VLIVPYPDQRDDLGIKRGAVMSASKTTKKPTEHAFTLWRAFSRGGVRFLAQALSVLIIRTNPRISGYRFTVNRHGSYYPTELALSDDQFVSFRKG
jgi:hypothetical protein